ncbi:MAG: hypothetical protein RR426_08780, partial [Oscillospiraceae bacterium]
AYSTAKIIPYFYAVVNRIFLHFHKHFPRDAPAPTTGGGMGRLCICHLYNTGCIFAMALATEFCFWGAYPPSFSIYFHILTVYRLWFLRLFSLYTENLQLFSVSFHKISFSALFT